MAGVDIWRPASEPQKSTISHTVLLNVPKGLYELRRVHEKTRDWEKKDLRRKKWWCSRGWNSAVSRQFVFVSWADRAPSMKITQMRSPIHLRGGRQVSNTHTHTHTHTSCQYFWQHYTAGFTPITFLLSPLSRPTNFITFIIIIHLHY